MVSSLITGCCDHRRCPSVRRACDRDQEPPAYPLRTAAYGDDPEGQEGPRAFVGRFGPGFLACIPRSHALRLRTAKIRPVLRRMVDLSVRARRRPGADR